MNSCNMNLKISVGCKICATLLFVFDVALIIDLGITQTFCTCKSCLIMLGSLMSSQLFCSPKSTLALLSCFDVHLSTWKSALSFMHCLDVSFQRVTFSEGLIAAAVACTLILFLSFVCSNVSLQSCASSEALATTSPRTHMVSDVGMGAFDMVFQVSFSEKVLRTVCMGAFERPSICMRA